MTNAAERSIRRSDLENWSRQIHSLARTFAAGAPYALVLLKKICVRSKSIMKSLCLLRGTEEDAARKMFVFGSQGANYSFPISITAPPNTQAKSNFPPPRGQLHREGRHAWFSTQNRSNSPRLPRRLRRRKSKRAAACAAPRKFTTAPKKPSQHLYDAARKERDAGCLFLSLPSASCCFSLVVGAHRPRGTLICRAREINFPCRLNESKTAWPMACLHSPARGQLINYTHFSPVQAPRDPKCHSPHSLGKNTNEPHISCHHFFHAARNLNWCTVFCFPVS